MRVSKVMVVNSPRCKGQNWRAPTGIKTFHRASHPTAMDSQSDKASSQASSSSGMSFSGFSFLKKVSQSRVKLEAGAGLGGGGDGERARGHAVDEGKDYVLSLEGKTIHRLVGWLVTADLSIRMQYSLLYYATFLCYYKCRGKWIIGSNCKMC